MKHNSVVVIILITTPFLNAQSRVSLAAPDKPAAIQPCSDSPSKTEPAVEAVQLSAVRRIFVESFGDDPISKEMQSMIVSSLVGMKKFVVTENPRRADAILKGVALEKTSQEVHSYSEGTAVRQAAINDSSLHTETLNEAKLSIRLVNADGDVIWTTTQESKGAKYKGASADVADMCVKQLLRDVAKVEGNTAQSTAPSESTPAQR